MKDTFPLLRKHGKPVRFGGEGPRMNGKVFHLPHWNKWRDAQRVKFLRNAAETYGQDPRIRQFVITRILGGRLSRSYTAQAAQILRWVQQNITYYNETREQLQSPWYTLEVRYGDCDDMSILLAAFFEAMKLPWRFVLSGVQRGTGRKMRWVEGTPEPANVRYTHIYTMVGDRPFVPNSWAYADATVKSAPLGWDVIAHGGGILPEMSGALAGVGDLSITGGAIAAEVVGDRPKEAVVKQIAVAVVVGVSVSVLSQLVLDRLRK